MLKNLEIYQKKSYSIKKSPTFLLDFEINFATYFFGAGGEVFPGAVGLFPLFPPEGFPVLLGPFAGVLPFAILINFCFAYYF